MVERLRAVPSWAWLVVIVIGSFGFRAWLSRHMLAPFIMTDELIYAELGKSLAATQSFEIRGYPVTGYGLLYSTLISPAYALFDALTDAYAAVKVVNSLVMSLAALPAYLIARRVVAPPLALLAALLAVALPSLVYTATVMTENVYYPLTLLVAWATLVALERPRWRSAALVAVTLGLALATRSQAVSLAAGILSAPFVLAIVEGSGFARIRASWRLYALFGATALVVVVGQVLRGQSLQALLGAYAVVGDRSYDAGAVLRFWLWHVEELTLYLGVVPVVATLVLLGRSRKLPARLQEHLAVTVTFSIWTTFVVAAFASEFAGRIQERNAFAVAPLFLTALVAWVSIGAPRPWPPVAASATLAIGLVVVFPYTRFIDEPAKSDTLAILPIWSAYGHLPFGSIWFSVLLGALAITAVFIVVPTHLAVLVPVAVLFWFAVVGQSVWSGQRGFVQAGAGALFQGIRGAPRDWIDNAVPGGATTGIVWTGLTDRFTINVNEFFNRSVGPVYYVGGPTPGNLPETGITVDPDDGILRRADGSPLTDRYLVTDASIELDGRALARDLPLGLTLWEVAGGAPHKVDVTWTGLYPNDTWSGPSVRYVRKNCTTGVLQVSLHSDASLFRTPQTVVASVAGRPVARIRFQAPDDAVLRVPLTPDADGACRVTFDVSPTAVPGGGDARRLGVHFDAFNYELR